MSSSKCEPGSEEVLDDLNDKPRNICRTDSRGKRNDNLLYFILIFFTDSLKILQVKLNYSSERNRIKYMLPTTTASLFNVMEEKRKAGTF